MPRTWHRDLSFGRDLLRGATPRGVLWVSELKGGDRERGSYRLLVISESRFYVTNGKAGLVSGSMQHAHLFDLERINFVAGDRIEFHFAKKFSVILDDTVGPSIVSTVWNALMAMSYEVPRHRLPVLEGHAELVVDDDLLNDTLRSPSEGFAASYRGACDQLGVKPRSCVERYIGVALGGGSSPKTRENDDFVRVFDIGAACRDDNKFSDADIPALARPLSSTSHFDAVALSSRRNVPTREASAPPPKQENGTTAETAAAPQPPQPPAPAVVGESTTPKGPDIEAKLSSEAVRTLLGAVDMAPRMRRVLLVGVGLTAAKLEKIDAPNGFKKITHWNITDNPGLGQRGITKLLGDGTGGGPEKLERFECRGCGPLRALPLKPSWGPTLRYLDATRCDLGKSNDTLSSWLGDHAQVLEVLVLAHCGVNVFSIIAGVAVNTALTTKGILRILDLSLNKCQVIDNNKPDTGPVACRSLLAKATNLERLVLAKCELPLPALDALLTGLNDRAKTVASSDSSSEAPPPKPGALSHRDSLESESSQHSLHVSSFGGARNVALYLADNPMHNKHGAVFFDRLSPQGGSQRLCAPLRQLNLDRSYLGTVGLRDLFAALASSKAPHLTNLSLRCTASKGGLFANKKKHEEMARSLADVVLKCLALERLTLAGGDGSHFKADLLPALAALGKNATIRVLDVGNNHCGDDALQALAGSLSVNQTLQKLAVDGNSASASAIRSLAESLQKNQVLHTCDLPRKDTALAARNLTTDKERADLAKAMKDMKQALQRNYRAAQHRHRESSNKVSRPRRRSGVGAGYASFFSSHGDDQDDDDDDDDDDVTPNSAVSPASMSGIGSSAKEDDDDDVGGEEEEANNKRPDSTGLPMVTEDPKTEEPEVPLPAPQKAKTKADRESDVAHRMKIFEEILESETNYVRDLGVICHIFLAPIEKHEILKRDDVDKVFGNVRELRQIHEELLSKLRSAARKHRDVVHAGTSTEAKAAAELAQKHAQIFSEMVPFLRAYAGYCATYTTAIEVVKQLSEGRTNPKFTKFMQRATNVPQCRGLDLASFLIKPPQRLCKYPLFFRDLLKHIDDGDGANPLDVQSAELISQTLAAVQGVTNTVNQTMATSGSQAKVFEIFKENFDCSDALADLVSPTRRFLVEGDVEFATHEKAPKKHHFYLFNELLVLATPKKSLVSGAEVVGKYKVKHRFALVDVSITDAPASISLNANDHFFLIRFEDQGSGGSTSVHWASEGRPQRADFLLWCDDANKCEQLRGALEQACYDLRILHEGLQNRRRHSSSQSSKRAVPAVVAANTPSPTSSDGTLTKSNSAAALEPDASDDDDDDGPPVAPPPQITRPTKPPPPPPTKGKGTHGAAR